MFVVSRPGRRDRAVVRRGGAAAAAAGWTRTFLLYADGFSKEMDINSASPDDVAPLPFHGDDALSVPAPANTIRATPAHREYLARYNTRVVHSDLPSLDVAAPR